MIKEFARVLASLALGDVISRLVVIPLPASVLGLLILFGWLCKRGSVPAALNTTADRTLEMFGLFFVPAGVGVVAYKHHITSDYLAIAITISAGTLVTIAVAALAASWMTRYDVGENRS